MTGWDDGMTLGEARDWLRERIEDGEECPCCRQFAKVYRRRLYATMTGNELAAHMKARLLAMALTKEQLETIIGWREDIYSMVMPSEADILMPLRAALEIHDAKD